MTELHRPRTEQELRTALGAFCQAVWTQSRAPIQIFSIPPRPDDADIILVDGIDELTRLRAQVAANARLRAGLAGLRRGHVTASDYYEECPKAYSADRRAWIRAHHTDWADWLDAPCSCGADEHNARIDALLTAP